VIGSTPASLNTTALDTLVGSSGKSSAWWVSLAAIIDATHNGSQITPPGTIVGGGPIALSDVVGLGEGLSTLTIGTGSESAALETFAQRSGLHWSDIKATYLANLPPPPQTAVSTGSTLNGTAIADMLVGGVGNDTLDGTAGGGTGADQLYGGAGNDTLKAGSDGSLMDGGTGDDDYYYNGGKSDYLVDEGGSDVLHLVAGVTLDTAYYYRTADNGGGFYNLKFLTTSAKEIVLQDQFDPNNSNAVVENAFDKVIRGTGGSISTSMTMQTLGTSGNDTMTSFSGPFLWSGSGTHFNAPAEDIRAGDGNDTVTVSNLNGNGEPGATVEGENGNDTLIAIGDGYVANDTYNSKNGYNWEIQLAGDDGDDTLIAQSGNVDMYGSTGNDTFIWRGGQGR
jgi:Ca2+-binding RTX toxin-like protein